MKIQNVKTKVIGPVLLLIPMACMHLGDGHHDGGHHSGDHHSSIRQSSYQYSTYERATSSTIEGRRNSMMAQEGTQTQPEGEGEKGR